MGEYGRRDLTNYGGSKNIADQTVLLRLAIMRTLQARFPSANDENCARFGIATALRLTRASPAVVMTNGKSQWITVWRHLTPNNLT